MPKRMKFKTSGNNHAQVINLREKGTCCTGKVIMPDNVIFYLGIIFLGMTVCVNLHIVTRKIFDHVSNVITI